MTTAVTRDELVRQLTVLADEKRLLAAENGKLRRELGAAKRTLKTEVARQTYELGKKTVEVDQLRDDQTGLSKNLLDARRKAKVLASRERQIVEKHLSFLFNARDRGRRKERVPRLFYAWRAHMRSERERRHGAKALGRALSRMQRLRLGNGWRSWKEADAAAQVELMRQKMAQVRSERGEVLLRRVAAAMVGISQKTCFQAWHICARAERRKAKKWWRTLIRARDSLRRAGFARWARITHETAIDAFKAKAKAAKHAHGVALLHRLKRVLFVVADPAAVLRAWAKAAAEASETRVRLRACLVRLQRRNLAKSWTRWRFASAAATQEQTRLKMDAFRRSRGEMVLRRLGAALRGQHVAAIMGEWRRWAEQQAREGREADFEEMAQRQRGRELQRRGEDKLRRLAARLMGATAAVCFRAWRRHSVHRRRSARLLRRAICHGLHLRLSRGFAGFKRWADAARLEELRERMDDFSRGQGIEKLRRMAADMMGKGASVCFKAWRNYTEQSIQAQDDKLDGADVMRRTMLKMLHVQLAGAWAVWQRYLLTLAVRNARRGLDDLRRAQGEEKLRRLGIALRGTGKRAVFTEWARVAARTSAARALQGARDKIATASRDEGLAKLRRLAAQLMGASLAVCFRAWRRHSTHRLRAARLLRRAICHGLHLRLSRGFAGLKRWADAARLEELRQKMGAFRRGQGIEKLRGMAADMMGASASVCFQAWRDLTSGRHAEAHRREKVRRVFRRLLLARRRAAMAAWRRGLDAAALQAMQDKMAAASRDEGLAKLRRLAASMMGNSASAVLDAWRRTTVAAVAERKHLRGVMRRAAARMQRLELVTGMRRWQGQVLELKQAEDVLELRARMIAFKRKAGKDKLAKIGAAIRGANVRACFAAWWRVSGGHPEAKMERRLRLRVNAFRVDQGVARLRCVRQQLRAAHRAAVFRAWRDVVRVRRLTELSAALAGTREDATKLKARVTELIATVDVSNRKARASALSAIAAERVVAAGASASVATAGATAVVAAGGGPNRFSVHGESEMANMRRSLAGLETDLRAMRISRARAMEDTARWKATAEALQDELLLLKDPQRSPLMDRPPLVPARVLAAHRRRKKEAGQVHRDLRKRRPQPPSGAAPWRRRGTMRPLQPSVNQQLNSPRARRGIRGLVDDDNAPQQGELALLIESGWGLTLKPIVKDEDGIEVEEGDGLPPTPLPRDVEEDAEAFSAVVRDFMRSPQPQPSATQDTQSNNEVQRGWQS